MLPGNNVYTLVKRILLVVAVSLFFLPRNPVAAASSAVDSGVDQTRLGAVQQASLVGSDIQSLSEFGWSVSISGNTAVVGARDHDPDLGQGPITNAGAAYIFVRSGTTWIQEAKLVANDAETGDTFGVSVAIDGNTVVVGATGVDLESDKNAGGAYVFVREGVNWKQKAKITASEPSTDDAFGVSVAIDNGTIVIGADSKDLSSLIDAGAAYVFVFRGNSWDQKAKLLPQDADFGALFGSSVAISGDRIVVGATQNPPEGTSGPGSAYVFVGKGNSWKQEAQLSPDEAHSGDFFGGAVAISGSTVVVGAKFADPNLGNGRITNGGTTYVFKRIGDEWEQQATLVPLDAQVFGEFGQSVAIGAGVIAVGADGTSQAGYIDAGAAYLFAIEDNEWTQQSRVHAEFPYEQDFFGKSIGLSGNELIVGATGRDPAQKGQAGEAFVFLVTQVQLPETGFRPGKITSLSIQPPSKAYSDLGELWLEIPALQVRTSIVGVPPGGSGWDTTWLWDQAGYLEGTAFPTWEGNTGIAAHTSLPDGGPGPFANLNLLKWGQKVVIHGWGQRYIYEIREVSQVRPWDLSILKHETYDWITLITCQDYDEVAGNYSWRTVVRAVLISVENE